MPDATPAFFRLTGSGIDLFVRLTPRAAHDAVEGVEATADGKAHLAARVRALPEKGAANAALEALIAAALDCPRRGVAVVAGSSARLKTVRVSGDPAVLAAKAGALAELGSRRKGV